MLIASFIIFDAIKKADNPADYLLETNVAIYYFNSSQKLMALAAATLRESTP